MTTAQQALERVNKLACDYGSRQIFMATQSIESAIEQMGTSVRVAGILEPKTKAHFEALGYTIGEYRDPVRTCVFNEFLISWNKPTR